MAAAAEELGDDVEVKAARSVKQGLRGKTHVEVLVTRPAGPARPPLPPSERPPSEQPQRAGAARRGASRAADPVESTLAALLASAEAEEDELQRLTSAGREVDLRVGAGADRSSVVPFDPPQLAGNPSFAAEFAAAFPAALAAAQAADADVRPAELERDVRPVRDNDFTARVREALRRVPQEDDAPPAIRALDVDDTDELEIIQPSTPAPLPRAAIVRASHVQPVAHPAPELIDAPPARPIDQPQPHRHDVHPPAQADRDRRPRPFPGPLAMAGRPAGLQRPAGSGWSVHRLRDLGVPEAVLAALPAEEPTDDLRWLVALTDAITATIPAPAENGTADVTASGTGLRGALALLRLGVEGVPPQALTVEGRAVPATATELALAVRAGILR